MSQMYAMMCEFSGPGPLLKAAKGLRDAGYKDFEVYSPFPIHGMDQAMGLKPSNLPWIVLACGIVGVVFGFWLQSWASTSAYKLIISGKPLFSYQAFVPVTFELMVLFSAFGAVFGMFALNGLPQLYHAVFRYSRFCTATSHGFFLSVAYQDPLFEIHKTSELLTSMGATSLESVGDSL